MAVYDVRVSFIGASEPPTPAIVSFAGGALSMEVSGNEIGRWRIADLAPARSNESFLISAEGESLVIEVDDPDAFAASLGLSPLPPEPVPPAGVASLLSPVVSALEEPVEVVPPGGRHVAEVTSSSVAWWKFWSGDAWRDWLGKRRPWREYRKQTGSRASNRKVQRPGSVRHWPTSFGSGC